MAAIAVAMTKPPRMNGTRERGREASGAVCQAWMVDAFSARGGFVACAKAPGGESMTAFAAAGMAAMWTGDAARGGGWWADGAGWDADAGCDAGVRCDAGVGCDTGAGCGDGGREDG